MPSADQNPPAPEPSPGNPARERTWFVFYLLASSALLVIESHTPTGSADWMFHLLLIWVVSATCSPRQLAWAGAVSSSCIVAGLVLSGPAAFASWVHLIRRGVVIVTIWLIVYYSRRHSATAERERKALLAQHELELKALRGIIPICAWCKRIRTDSGAWQQIEAYIRDHSEADFSHGICAECLAKLNDQRPASPP